MTQTIEVAGTARADTWTIDPAHTHVEFGVKHMMIATVKGTFADVSGTVTMPEDGRMPSVDVTIAAASINTRIDARDAHLRSADFFDAERYPTLRFVSSEVVRSGSGWRMTGDLTMRGVTRSVTLAVEKQGSRRDEDGVVHAGFSAKGKIDRREWGLTWNQAIEAGGVLVGDEVKLTVEAELVAGSAE